MTNISPKIYNDALKEIQERNNKVSEFSKKCEVEKRDLENKYWEFIWDLKDKIRNLERERNKKIEDIKNKEYSYESTLIKEYSSQQEIIKYTEKLFGMIDLFAFNLEDTIPEEPVDVIADDDYKKIYVEIGRNRKPVNCFSLNFVVKKIFTEDMISTIRWPWAIILKGASSEEVLLEWYQKNKNNLKFKWGNGTIYLSDVLSEFSELEKIYEQAKELYKQRQWQLAYLYHKKYYYENHYSDGTKTEEYKAILERIKIIKTEQKNLPLLIAEIKTEDGKKEFSKRLTK